MRHTPAQIRQLLADQQASGLSIAKCCRQANPCRPAFARSAPPPNQLHVAYSYQAACASTYAE